MIEARLQDWVTVTSGPKLHHLDQVRRELA